MVGRNPDPGITDDSKFVGLDNLPRRAEKPEPGRIHTNPGLLGIKRTSPKGEDNPSFWLVFNE
jgi:hypothetical protein